MLLRQAHVLRSQKTGPEHLPRYFKNPRIQIFPYRSNSKQWALFFITEKKGADVTESYELRAVMPRNYDKEAFAWAINHLKFQFRITEEPTFEEWPSNHGAQLLLAEGLLQQLCQKAAPISSTVREKFAVESLATLRSLRTAAVQANNAEVEEVCNENAALHQAFLKLFVPILPPGMRVPTAALPSVDRTLTL